ncbi:hypothetical protein ALC60_10778, partial [Trachymyrmex zeteki]
ELKLSIESAKKSAPGLDQIDYLPSEYIITLLNIYNLLFNEGSFLENWNHALVTLIPKRSSAGFRPISLLSCFFKICEDILLLQYADDIVIFATNRDIKAARLSVQTS